MIYSKKTAALKLGISTKTLERRIKEGALKFHQIGKRVLFDDDDLTTYWDSCSRQLQKIGEEV